jgi:cobalt/nickel transport system permease protein
VHIPDGYIGAATSLGAGVVAAGGITFAVRKTADWLDDRSVPLTGLVAAFVFAAQMLNFPVVAGTSGHLIGAVLAAVLVGPWAGALCLAVVVFMQSLFADGGISAIGLNVLNMSLVAGVGGYGIFIVLRRILPAARTSITMAAGVAAGASVVLSAGAFVLEFALGGNAPVSITALAGAMLSVHALIGIGEGVITAATVGLVLGVRPDLVHGARGMAVALRPAETSLVGERVT